MFKFIAIAVIFGLVAADNIDKDAEIRSFANDINEDGTYSYQFDTSNGISIQESGTGGVYASGSAAHVAPDGTPINLVYTADEDGFHPQGAHLPVAPPVPEHILRALEWIRTHPAKDEPQQQRKY